MRLSNLNHWHCNKINVHIVRTPGNGYVTRNSASTLHCEKNNDHLTEPENNKGPSGQDIIKLFMENDMADQRFYATGKRKSAVARVWLKPGDGNFTVNKQTLEEYFGGNNSARLNTERPFVMTDTTAKWDVIATLKGGGKSAQCDALRHGIAKALIEADPEHRLTLKKGRLLTRDPRVKERKKYGQKGARANYQFSKR